MSDLLIHSARRLTDEEAGVHGNRWGVIDDDVPSLLGQWLGIAVQEAELAAFGIADKSELQQVRSMGEPEGAALLYTGSDKGISKNGLMSILHLNHVDSDQRVSNLLCSAFPFFGDGIDIEAEVESINLFPNRLEARLGLEMDAGGMLFAFDPFYWQNRVVYRKGESYLFSVSALAYEMKLAPEIEHVIDDEYQIRRFRARDAWVKAHGYWSREDEEASMAAWAPTSSDDLEPIRISMANMTALLPSSLGPADDAQYQGEVVRVTPHAARILDMDFWRIDTVVMRSDANLTLPIYVAERLFRDDWRPQVGQYVAGSLWLQAYAKAPSGHIDLGRADR